MEAISQAGSAVGILAGDGVVIAAEKRITSKLLDKRSITEKMFKIDEHVAVAVAGITSDANILINYTRTEAQKYTFTYQEPIPIEQLLNRICDLKQGYTQFGGMRPFGVSFLFAGWDEHFGYQLYMSDPSGNYGGWKAKAIGANSSAAQAILKSEYKNHKETVEDALTLAVKVLSKSMDTTTPTPDKIEVSTVTRTPEGKVVYRVFSKEELEVLLKKTSVILTAEKAKETAKDEDMGDPKAAKGDI